MDEQTLGNFLRMSGGQDQASGWAPTADDMKDAMARLMAPDANLDALAGPPRKPLYPSLADTLGRQADQYNRMPNGPMHPDHQGNTPTYDPIGNGLGVPRFGGGAALPPSRVLDNKTVPGVDMWMKPQMPAPTRGFR